MSSPLHFGKYLLVDKIGTGGMAELYLAKQTGLKGFEKVIAIKRILPHLTQDTEFVNMFINEAKLAALLSHQNIVQIFDLGHVEGIYYIAMEYIMGKDLRSLLRKRKEKKTLMPIELSLMITSRVCSGLDYAHRKKDLYGNDLNIVHRDVSPQNILISYEGEVKIVDFGIAKAASGGSETKAGVLKGKLAYMSPEQAWGKPVDRRTDVFATGVVLYEMLTGERPFKASSDFELLEKVRQATFDPPSKLNPEISPDLESIMLKALAKDPAERYQTTSELELDLENLVVSRGYGLSSLNLSQYMSALFKEEMELDTQRFQIATTVNLSDTVVDQTLRRPVTPPQVDRTPTGSAGRIEKTPSAGRLTQITKQRQETRQKHPVLTLFLWSIPLAIMALSTVAYLRPNFVLKVIRQQPWLQPMEQTVRTHMENLGLIPPANKSEPKVAVLSPMEDPTAPPVHSELQADETIHTDRSGAPLGTEIQGSLPQTPVPAHINPSPIPSTPGADGLIPPMQPPVPGRHRPGLNKGLNEDQRKEIKQLFEMAKQQYAERDLRSLEDTLRKIIEIDPGASRAYHLLGTVYLERKEEEAAFRIFSEAVNLFPQDPMLRYDLGALYYKRELYDLARQELSKALEITPHFPKAPQTRQLLLSLQHAGQIVPFRAPHLPEGNSNPDPLSPQPPVTDWIGPEDPLQEDMMHDPALDGTVGQ